MAKLSQGILGGISGKIGNIVGSSWKGIAVIKTKPLSVANPRTASQVAQRNSMTGIVKLSVSVLSTIIKPLWDRAAQYMSGYNAFVKENIGNVDEDGIVDCDNVIFSKGKMQPTPMVSLTADISDGEVNASWENDTGEGYKLSTDEAFAVCMNMQRQTVTVTSAEFTRATGSVTLGIPTGTLTGDECHVYLMFRRADGTVIGQQSHSITGFAA